MVGDVSIVERAAIERSGATGVADVLARLPGIEIARNGGLGNSTSVFIRGAESRFTAVYIDGVRVDSQATGGASWESIPLAQIDRIEVLRGPAAAVYGSDAIGGVIQLFTHKGEAGVSPYVGVGIGSLGLRKIEAGVSGATGAVDYAFGLARERSDGFNVNLAKGYNPDRDGYRNTSANARIGLQISAQQRVEATLLQGTLNSGYDAYGYTLAKAVDDRNMYRLRSAGLSWTSQWNEVWKTRVQITDSSSRYQTQPDFYLTETRLRGYLLQNELRFGAHLVTATLERREDKLDNAPGVGPDASPGLTRSRSQNALAIGYSVVQGPHALQLNLRHDNDSEFGGRNTSSAAYGYSITKSLRATASAGTAFRAPTLYQRFSEYGITSLKPEQSRNVELGLRYAEDDSSLGLVAYRNQVRNQIDFDNNATRCAAAAPPFGYPGCYGNVARAQYQGMTLSASQRFGDLSLHSALDLQDPRNDLTDKVLVRRARRHASLGADLRVGSWTVGAEVQASGKRYADVANTQTLGGYGLINLSASAPLTHVMPGLSLVARVDNLANRDYQLVRNYATAGRTAYLGLKWAPKL